jgi:hypothetical protein
MNHQKWAIGDLVTLEPYGEGHVTEVIGSGLFLRVQWPQFDMPQLVTTITFPKRPKAPQKREQ